ncbi:hypothetical protein [Escherichia coli]
MNNPVCLDDWLIGFKSLCLMNPLMIFIKIIKLR